MNGGKQMKQERMRILDLLESGKITADEAAKLLESIKRPNGQDSWFDGETAEHVGEKFQHFTKHVDKFTKDFGGRVELVYKDLEPKIKKVSQAVLEKTASVFDDISKSLNEALENAKKAADETDEDECCCCGDDEPKDETCGDDEPREN
jgi:DNA-binding ferritin-like protein (Dps family)